MPHSLPQGDALHYIASWLKLQPRQSGGDCAAEVIKAATCSYRGNAATAALMQRWLNLLPASGTAVAEQGANVEMAQGLTSQILQHFSAERLDASLLSSACAAGRSGPLAPRWLDEVLKTPRWRALLLKLSSGGQLGAAAAGLGASDSRSGVLDFALRRAAERGELEGGWLGSAGLVPYFPAYDSALCSLLQQVLVWNSVALFYVPFAHV